MRHYRSTYEPCFELPPRLAAANERRLAANATMLWQEHCNGGAMPPLAGYARAALPAEIAAHSVLIDLRVPGTLWLETVGSRLAAVFGLAVGVLSDAPDHTLAGWLRRACVALGDTMVPVPFEAKLAASDGEARLLARGVLLPLADANGSLGVAHAVVTWKELLTANATDRLRCELAAVWPAGGGQPRDAFG